MFNKFWQCNKYTAKQLKNVDFITCWSSQNVSNNSYEKIKEVLRLCEKFRYFGALNSSGVKKSV